MKFVYYINFQKNYSITESTANVNIPMENGVLCVRPTQMNVFSPSILNQIDQSTFVHLKQLQQNLNMIMNYAANKNIEF